METLLALMLISLLLVSASQFLIKNQVISSSLSMRFQVAGEVHSLILDLMRDLRQGAYISDNSSSTRLEYTTYDNSGNALRKIYSLIAEDGKFVLKLSLDGGNTWISPYRISAYNRYTLPGMPKFLYAGPDNNCTDFPDTDNNGVWLSGTDGAGSSASCAQGSSTPLGKPSQSRKVILRNFNFTTGRGSPEGLRNLPLDIFMAVSSGLVRSTSSPLAPAVKDSALVQKFTTNTADSLFGAAFGVRGLCWDASRGRLLLVGHHASGANYLFSADRQGVLIGTAPSTTDSAIQLDGVALEKDGRSAMVLDSTANKLYRFDLTGAGPLSPLTTLSLSGLVNNATSIAYDAATPNDFYIVGADPVTSAFKIYERDKTSGALVGSAWSLPSAFNSTSPPGGLAIEPLTGDFLLVRNYVNVSGSEQGIDIYRIDRSNGNSSSFSVDISDFDSVATTATGYWGLAYDALHNRLFLADNATAKVYEVAPPVLITARN